MGRNSFSLVSVEYQCPILLNMLPTLWNKEANCTVDPHDLLTYVHRMDTAAEIGLTVGDTPVSPEGWCMGNKTKSLNGEHYKVLGIQACGSGCCSRRWERQILVQGLWLLLLGRIIQTP